MNCTCNGLGSWCVLHGITYTPMPPQLIIQPLGDIAVIPPKGWECPKCEAIMAPHIPNCVNCVGKKV